MSELQAKAQEAYEWFESASRPDESRFIRLRDGAPEWVSDLVHDAHGGNFLPDDWKYQWVMEALEYIAEADDPQESAEFADNAVSVYTGERFAWLSSNLNRADYVDEAASEGLVDSRDGDPGIVARIGVGQYVEAQEVYDLVLQALQS